VFNHPHNFGEIITRVNAARRANKCLHDNLSLNFHTTDNDLLICYSKCSIDTTNIILVVVNLDLHHTQSGWVDLPIAHFGITEHDTYYLHDLLDDAKYLWQGRRNYIELNPQKLPAHVFQITRVIQHEQ